ncbi:MAG: radical SAM protein [archaeon]
MAMLHFEDIRFVDSRDEIVVRLYRSFEFSIPKSEFGGHDMVQVDSGDLVLDMNDRKADSLFSRLLTKYLGSMKSTINDKPAAYIHKNSGIPLIGCIYFGLVDRGTNVIEVKPFTGCNLNCIYCSVDEGRMSKCMHNYVVEWEYLVEEFEKLVKHKESKTIEAHIAGHAEPTLYPRLAHLTEALSRIKGVETVAIDTNGTLLNELTVDTLREHGLTRVNLSINAMDSELASRIAGQPYPIDHVKKVAKHINKHMSLVIAPTWIPGINDEEIPKIIEFALELKRDTGKMPEIGIQNFLRYKHGRNPVQSRGFEHFYKDLKKLEKHYKVNLTDFSKMGFIFEDTKPLPKPMKKDDVIEGVFAVMGRRPGEHLYTAKERIISVFSTKEPKKRARLRIIKDSDNIFIGKIV